MIFTIVYADWWFKFWHIVSDLILRSFCQNS